MLIARGKTGNTAKTRADSTDVSETRSQIANVYAGLRILESDSYIVRFWKHCRLSASICKPLQTLADYRLSGLSATPCGLLSE